MKLITGLSNKNEFAKTFLIDIDYTNKKALKKTINIDEKTLILKEEFHITFLGSTLADELYKHLKNKKKQSQEQIEQSYLKIENKTKEMLKTAEISYGTSCINEVPKKSLIFDCKCFLLEKKYENQEIREAIIQIIKLNIYEEFFKFLEGAFGYYPKRGIPKCHITIYYKNKPIGLNTYKDFEKYKIKEVELFN